MGLTQIDPRPALPPTIQRRFTEIESDIRSLWRMVNMGSTITSITTTATSTVGEETSGGGSSSGGLTMGTTNPKELGTKDPGNSVYASHQDHVHPTTIGGVPIFTEAGGTLTGTLTAPGITSTNGLTVSSGSTSVQNFSSNGSFQATLNASALFVRDGASIRVIIEADPTNNSAGGDSWVPDLMLYMDGRLSSLRLGMNSNNDGEVNLGHSANLLFKTANTTRLTISSTGAVTVAGTSTLTGAVTASASLSVGTTLSVTGASNLTGTVTTTANLAVGTSATIGTALSVGTTLSVTGTSTLTGAVTIGSTLTVQGTGASSIAGPTSIAKVLTLGAQDGVNDGGQVVLSGAGSNPSWTVRNNAGLLRFTSGSSDFFFLDANAGVSSGVLVNGKKFHVRQADGTPKFLLDPDAVNTYTSSFGMATFPSQSLDGDALINGTVTSLKLSATALAIGSIPTGTANSSRGRFLRYVASTSTYSSLDTASQGIDGLRHLNGATRVADGAAYGGFCIQSSALTNTIVMQGPFYGSDSGDYTGSPGLVPGRYRGTVYLKAGTSSTNTADALVIRAKIGSTVYGTATFKRNELPDVYTGLSFIFTLDVDTRNTTGLYYEVETLASSFTLRISHVRAETYTGMGPGEVITFIRNAEITDAQIASLTATKLTAGTIQTDDIWLGVSGMLWTGPDGTRDANGVRTALPGDRLEFKGGGSNSGRGIFGYDGGYNTVRLTSDGQFQLRTKFTNILSAADSDFESASSAGWMNSSNAGGVTTSTTTAYNGTRSLRWTGTTTAVSRVRTIGTTGNAPASPLSLLPSTKYTMSGYFRPQSGNTVTITPGMIVWNSSGNTIGGAVANGPAVSCPPGVWTRVSLTFTTPPNVSMTGALTFESNGHSAGQFIYMDAVVFELGDLTTYTPTRNWLNLEPNKFEFWLDNSRKVLINGNTGDVIIEGTITATAGAIGGWDIRSNKLDTQVGTGNEVGLSGEGSTAADVAIWAGGSRSAAPFRVQKDGTVWASKGYIAGTTIQDNSITARALTLGSYENLAIDPSFEQGTSTGLGTTFWNEAERKGWSTAQAGAANDWYINVSATANGRRSGRRAASFRLLSTDSLNGFPSIIAGAQSNSLTAAFDPAVTTVIPATPGDTIYVEGWIGRSGNVSGGSGMRAVVQFRQADGTIISTATGSYVVPTAATNGLTERVSVSAVAPANTTHITGGVQVASDSTTTGTTDFRVDDILIRKALNGEALIDGTLTVTKMANIVGAAGRVELTGSGISLWNAPTGGSKVVDLNTATGKGSFAGDISASAITGSILSTTTFAAGTNWAAGTVVPSSNSSIDIFKGAGEVPTLLLKDDSYGTKIQPVTTLTSGIRTHSLTIRPGYYYGTGSVAAWADYGNGYLQFSQIMDTVGLTATNEIKTNMPFVSTSTLDVNKIKRGGGSLAGTQYAERRRTTTLTISNNSWTTVFFPTSVNAVQNEGTMYSGTDGSWTVPTTGMYHLSATVTWSNYTNTNMARTIQWITSANWVKAQNTIFAGDVYVVGASAAVYLVAGEVLYVKVFHNSGANHALEADSFSTPCRASVTLIA